MYLFLTFISHTKLDIDKVFLILHIWISLYFINTYYFNTFGLLLIVFLNFLRYDPKNNSWSTVAPLSVPRDAVAVCSLGDKLYVVGGYDGHTYLNTVESYDVQNDEWKEVLLLKVLKLVHFRF